MSVGTNHAGGRDGGPHGPSEPAAAAVARVLDALPDGLLLLDAAGRVVRVNPEGAALLDLAADEVLCRDAASVAGTGPDGDVWRTALVTMRVEGHCRFSARLPQGGRPPRTVLVRGRRLPEAVGTATHLLVLTDVTADREREVRLRERADAFESLVEHSPDAIVRLDRDLSHTYVNRATERITGRARDDFLGRTSRDLGYPEELLTLWERELRASLGDGTPRDLEYEFAGEDGTRYMASTIVPESGPDDDPGGLVVVTRDMTVRRRLEQRLEVERAEHRRLARREAALRRVAEVVARGDPSGRVFDVAAEESARLLDADAGWVICTDGVTEAVGGWRSGRLEHRRLSLAALAGADAALGRALRTGAPARVTDYADLPGAGPEALVAAGLRSGAAAPIAAAGERWGVLLVARADPGIAPGAEEVLGRFGDLIGTALANLRAARELDRLAHTDALTGLLNRRGFSDRFAAEVHRARRHGDPMAVVIADIDHFKRVNDAHGHRAGDDALREVAARLVEASRRDEVVARVGGEEFAVLLPRVDLAGALAATERLRAHVSREPVGRAGSLTLSAGVACLRPGDDEDAIMSRADDALYRAKRRGRDRAEAEA